jgi:hydroxymethylpyrimidine pyrophosphatase-like HAD family hydrolase
MVRDADVGYAVANAVDSLKAVADKITVSVEDAAIARIIEEL